MLVAQAGKPKIVGVNWMTIKMRIEVGQRSFLRISRQTQRVADFWIDGKMWKWKRGSELRMKE